MNVPHSPVAAALGQRVRPVPAMPPRPVRPLPALTLLRTAVANSVSACDEELYDKLVVSRLYWPQRVLFLSDPDGIKRVLIDRFDNYPRLSGVRRIYEIEIGTGTLASEGETWRRHRRVATPTIDHRAVLADTPAMVALAERVADELEERCGQVIDLERWSVDLATTMFNHVLTGGRPDAGPLLAWMSKIPRRPAAIDLIPKPPWLHALVRNRRGRETAHLDRQLRGLIAERLEPGYAGPRDLLWRLAHQRDRRTGEVLPVEEVRDEAASLSAAGTATVRALTWFWYLVGTHPDVEARLHEELRRVLGSAPVTAEKLQQLPYARQIIDETLRLYPPIPAIMRESVARDEVCGVALPRRAVVAILPWVVHRHRRLWPDPDLFDPDRFTPEAKARQPRFAYLPFATGPRVCVGASLATTQMLAAVAVLGRRFRFVLASEEPVVPVGRITLRPRGGLPATVLGHVV